MDRYNIDSRFRWFMAALSGIAFSNQLSLGSGLNPRMEGTFSR